MPYRKDFNKLLADEEFQNGIINFNSFDRERKKAFINQYSVTKDEFIKAKTIINGLSFKEIDFSDEELNYLWKKLGIENTIVIPRRIPRNKKIINWISKAAAILFIPLLIASIWLFDRTHELQSFKDDKINQLTGMYNTVSAPVGGRTKAVLPDGSEVWLNSGSSLQYPILSKQSCREVKLKGEGFFKVIKDKAKPMLVTTSGMQVKVYGTTFNINAYEDNPDIETVLIEGNISIKKLDEKGNPADFEHKMKPGEVGKLNRQKNTIAIAKTNNIEIYTGWINGKYVFKNTQFKNILKRLERIHNVKFILEDEKIGEYYFDATLGDQNIDRIMEIFAVSLPIIWRSVSIERNKDQTFSTRKIVISKDKSREL
ncbi:FecR family protein [Maribellus maritimus]|uniref:FecR family protein n=1 Tax=Maribellus maritimus TaxID=2870838 RepID=UPI001EEC1AF0|nr:FecR family protein [Maribellus maritimus]MCG6190865.1 FecR family protein [Maribellus maritimus]